MKNIIFLLLITSLLASCSANKKSLYTWNKYENSGYKYVKNNNESTTNGLIEEYKKIINNQKGTRGMVPPGIYADYGFVLIQTNRVEEGKLMLQKEIELYPESKIFIKKIYAMLE